MHAERSRENGMTKVKYRAPKGYQDATAYLRVANAAAAIEFYAAAFGAKEKYRLTMPGGAVVGHAELWFGNTCVMLSDEFPDMGIVGPKTLGGVSALMALYVSNADAVFERAIAAGAKVKRPLTDEFYGDRSGQLEDPFGRSRRGWRTSAQRRCRSGSTRWSQHPSPRRSKRQKRSRRLRGEFTT